MGGVVWVELVGGVAWGVLVVWWVGGWVGGWEGGGCGQWVGSKVHIQQ